MTDGRIGRAVFWMLELFLMLCFVGIKYAADYLRSGKALTSPGPDWGSQG